MLFVFREKKKYEEKWKRLTIFLLSIKELHITCYMFQTMMMLFVFYNVPKLKKNPKTNKPKKKNKIPRSW